MKKHSYLARVLGKAARDAGLRVILEPDTHSLLLGQFTRRCRRIFPKGVNKHYRDKVNEVLNAIVLFCSSLVHVGGDANKTMSNTALKFSQPEGEDATGLRIDSAIENEDTGECRWVDVTAVHTGSDSYQVKELKTATSRKIAAEISSSIAAPDPLKFEPSPTLLERTTAKTEKYSRLLLVAKKQAIREETQAGSCLCDVCSLGLW